MIRPSSLSGALAGLAGVAIVTWWLVQSAQAAPSAPWAVAGVGVGLAAWVVRLVLARTGPVPAARAAAVAMIVAGGLSAAATDGAGLVPAAVGVLALAGDADLPAWAGPVAGVGAAGLVGAGALIAPPSLVSLLVMLTWLVIAVVGGLGRREAVRAQRAALDARARALELRAQAERVALARDLHDVLAHTLGALVIQLDAVEALLDAGRTTDARARAASARGLAGDGLGEARRAVAALRAPESTGDRVVEGTGLVQAVDALAAAHRELGGTIAFAVDGAPRALSGRLAGALERVAQEALSNARRHAPGAPVEVRLTFAPDGIRLRVENPLAAASAGASAPGGGYGLEGMRERVAAAGGLVRAGTDGARFVVEADAPAPAAGAPR